MNYSLVDAVELVLAAALFVPLLVLPGIALGAASGVLGFRRRTWIGRIGLGLVLAHAVLPVLDTLVVRTFSIPLAIALNLALALGGAAHLARAKPPGAPCLGMSMAFGGLWLALVMAAWIDFDVGGSLHVSLLAVDTVKHAATVRAIVETGAPPLDPFFLRDGRVGYYYFYYTISALAEVAGRGLLDSRAAVSGQVVWTGLALLALASMLLERAGLARATRRAVAILVALGATGGLQLLLNVPPAAGRGLWPSDTTGASEQVLHLLGSVLWVPHHVAALVAVWAGFLVLAERSADRAAPGEAAPGGDAPGPRTAEVVAGAAFASALGLSVWVTLPAVLTAGLWFVVLLREGRWRVARAILAAGAASLVLSCPHLADLARGRSYGALPIAFEVRWFVAADWMAPEGALRAVLRAALLPLNYAVEFGVFAVGTVAFWHARPRREGLGNEVARLLVLGTIAGLLTGGFLRSTILSNDLGWRAVLHAQLAALLWTTAVLLGAAERAPAGAAWTGSLWTSARRVSPVLAFALVVGQLGVAYDLVGLRGYGALALYNPAVAHLDPAVMREEREAYRWMNLHLPAGAVQQHDPGVGRALAFGLYGRHRVGIADGQNGLLFGAARAEVAQRYAALEPIFSSSMGLEEVRARAAANGVDVLVATARDGAWRAGAPWLREGPALYASERVRVIALKQVLEDPSREPSPFARPEVAPARAAEVRP